MKQSAIDPERLAALLEGRLSPNERRQILGQLAESDADREIYADAIAALGESANAAGVAGEILPNSRRQRWRAGVPARWFAVAAVLLIGVSLPLLRARLGGRATVSYAALLSVSDARTSAPPEAWSATRSASEALSAEAIAVRLGAKLTDLELAIRMSDSSAITTSRVIADLLDGLPGSGPVAAMFRNIAQDTPGSPIQRQAFGRAARAARELADAERVDLGEWLEAARIAAASRDSAFLRTRTAFAASERAMSSAVVPASAASIALRIHGEIAAPAPLDWGMLERDLTQLLRAAASRGTP